MGKTKDLGHLAHIVVYDAENHITVPAGITMHTNQLVASQAWVTTALGSYALSSALGSYVPTSRTITINGTTFDLSANRSWDITSMIYPAAGIALSTGTGWGTSITNNSGNWNTAFGWGNHASAGYLTGITSTQVTTALGFTPYNATNPAGYITGISFANVSSKPTTLSGYGITDAVPSARTITINGTAFDLSANRSWTVTATETDTLATVTARGATTTAAITTGVLTVNTGGTGTWGPFVVTSTNLWGDGATQYVTIGAGGAAGIMIYNPHIVWNSSTNASAFRMGRSGGVSTGAWYEIGTGASDNFFIAKNGFSSGTQFNINTSGNASFSGYLRTAGVASNAVLFNAGAASVDFGNAFGQGTTNRSVYFRGNTGVSAWWGGIDGNGNNIPFAAIDAVAGEFSFWRNTGGTGGGTWSNIMTMNASGLTMNSGNFIGNLSGNATTASSVAWGNVSGRPGWMAAASLVEAHANANEWRNSGFYENSGGGSNWPSQTWYNSINVRHSNQGNYHGFQIAMSYYDNNLWFRSYQGSGTFQSWAVAISSQNIGSQKVDGAFKLWSLTHPNDFYITHSWTGAHWFLTSNHGSPVRVGYADTAGSAPANGGTSSNTNSISNAVGGGYTWTGLQYFRSNRNTSSDSAPLQAFSDNGSGAIMSFHRGGHYAVNFGLDSDNVMRIGGWSAANNRFQMDMSGNLTMSGDITAYSDARVKENVKTIENALDKVLALRGVSYTRIDSEDKKTKIGVIAQETLPIVPEVVNQDNDGMYNVSYGNFGGLFIEAFKEQQKRIESQDKTIEELKELIYAITK